jgi:glutathione S-transferase
MTTEPREGGKATPRVSLRGSLTMALIGGRQRKDRPERTILQHFQGQVPAIAFDRGRCLVQSKRNHAVLRAGSRLPRDDAWAQAKIDEWLFWEQYSHEPYIAVLTKENHQLGQPRLACVHMIAWVTCRLPEMRSL